MTDMRQKEAFKRKPFNYKKKKFTLQKSYHDLIAESNEQMSSC